MNNRMHKFLWIIVAITLAALPLRGALALPMVAGADDLSPCAHGQQEGVQDVSAGFSDHGCEQDCSGERCDGACGAHVPASAALTGFITIPAGTPADVLGTEFFHSFTGYTAHPPFRPPITRS